MARYGREMVEQLLANPRYQAGVARGDSGRRTACRMKTPCPLFVQADFGLDAELQPKLVEIQGFPTLYAYQPLMAASYREAYGIDDRLATLPGGLERATNTTRCCGEAIVGRARSGERGAARNRSRASEDAPRFPAHRAELFGVRTVDIAALRKQGNRLFYHRDGSDVPMRRIYNRAIVDELVRKQIPLAFDFRDDLDVEWAGHPNWFFRLSKFSLPYLRPSGGAAHAVPGPRRTGGASRALRAEAALFVRRGGRDRRADGGADCRGPGGAAEPVHSAGARRFPAGGGDAVRPHQDRGAHHVHLAGDAARR